MHCNLNPTVYQQKLKVFTNVVTSCNAGLNFALLLLFLFLGHYSELLSNFTMPAWPGSLARQPCPAALPGSLARQPCPAALPGSLARQSCSVYLPGIGIGCVIKTNIFRKLGCFVMTQITHASVSLPISSLIEN
jgi:hypothetical protein